ncbi:hypothetical protein BDW60DRAFT_212445 [Aspergillus nidulans var. acristatus]
MASQDNKRMTQFDLASLRAHNPPLLKTGGRIPRKTEPKSIQGKPRDLVLPSLVSSVTNTPPRLPVQDGSPWKRYRSLYKENIGVPVTVVIHEEHPQNLLVIRTYDQSRVSVSQALRAAPHENIITVQEAFKHDGEIYLLHEYLPLSLDRIVGSPIYPDEVQLASILGQVINGLLYLESNGIHMDSLQCSEILLSLGGEVKIGKFQLVPASGSFHSQNVELLRRITLELMEGPDAGERSTGVRNLHRWPLGSDAVDFVSAITSAASLEDLRKHALISKTPWDKVHLVWLAHYMVKTTWNGCGLCEVN